MKGHYGLLGEKLGHSFSPAIHRALGGYDYELVELPREELGDWLRKTDFRGVNVTIPYKQDVIPFLDSLSERAAKIGAVKLLPNISKRMSGSVLGQSVSILTQIFCH